jgi:hypothetical protein
MEIIYLLDLFIVIPIIDAIFFISNTFNHYTALSLIANSSDLIYFILFELKTIGEWVERINELYIQ